MCEIKIHVPPFSKIYEIVFFEDFIRVLSVTPRFLSTGTLKSTLTNTFLSFKSNSVINIWVFNANLNIVFILLLIRGMKSI